VHKLATVIKRRGASEIKKGLAVDRDPVRRLKLRVV